jgi:hypothetical protein
MNLAVRLDWFVTGSQLPDHGTKTVVQLQISIDSASLAPLEQDRLIVAARWRHHSVTDDDDKDMPWLCSAYRGQLAGKIGVTMSNGFKSRVFGCEARSPLILCCDRAHRLGCGH